jgi:hypothetical protein
MQANELELYNHYNLASFSNNTVNLCPCVFVGIFDNLCCFQLLLVDTYTIISLATDSVWMFVSKG